MLPTRERFHMNRNSRSSGHLTVECVVKHYGDFVAVNNVSFSLDGGDALIEDLDTLTIVETDDLQNS